MSRAGSRWLLVPATANAICSPFLQSIVDQIERRQFLQPPRNSFRLPQPLEKLLEVVAIAAHGRRREIFTLPTGIGIKADQIGISHFGIWVKGLDAIYEDLKSKGVTFAVPPHTGVKTEAGTLRTAFVQDPVQNLWAHVQDLSDCLSHLSPLGSATQVMVEGKRYSVTPRASLPADQKRQEALRIARQCA